MDAPAAPGFALRVQHLSKCHSIYQQPRDRLKQFLLPPLRNLLGQPCRHYFREFWALRDVSFEVARGESVAIIGRNGSGKSTLLQMISGTLSPTDGTVQTQGRIAALLELGSGFNLEFTGRENVFLNGVILGMTVREIEQRLDDILAFADIGAFIDQPVKTYSSGMYVRLAFAIQVHVNPEILIVDEALSVGDFFFQQKCFARIRRMREDGLTLLYVSHDMGTVRDLCPRSVYLRQGQAVFIGDTQEAVRRYLSETDAGRSEGEPVARDAGARRGGRGSEPIEAALASAVWRSPEPDTSRLLAVVLRDGNGQPCTSVRMGQKLAVQVFFRTPATEAGHVSLILRNKFDQIVTCTGSYFLGLEALRAAPGQWAMFEMSLDCTIEAGLYSMDVSFGLPAGPNQGRVLESTGWFGPMQVRWDYENEPAPFLGQAGLPVAARFEPEVS
ncbi:ABC transporter ATP-binding protein [Ramlibacter sp.]|uniref:ABC transporter ATP-binding protein n=1 Tax=Ramlibacter sp. TaxID=1917967 RepID=UPI00262187C0|nr:ABC transporter ATP-binding protein [Ramlibacter sp.]